MAYDAEANKLTGYYEDYFGWDDQLKAPRFSCVFYFEGYLTGGTYRIITYYPSDYPFDTISGKIKVVDSVSVSVFLTSDHGGCSGSFTSNDTDIIFQLEKCSNWKQVRFVTKNKVYFYSSACGSGRKKSYLVRNDFFCVDQLIGNRAHGTYYGEKSTSGWIDLKDLNKQN